MYTWTIFMYFIFIVFIKRATSLTNTSIRQPSTYIKTVISPLSTRVQCKFVICNGWYE